MRPTMSIAQVDGAPGGDTSLGVMSYEELIAADVIDRLYNHFGDEGKALEEFDRQMAYYDQQHAEQPPATRRPTRAVH
jgi:hypothetical protein